MALPEKVGRLTTLTPARDDVAKEKTYAGATSLGPGRGEFTAFLKVPNLAREHAVKHHILREVLALAHPLMLPACEDRPLPWEMAGK